MKLFLMCVLLQTGACCTVGAQDVKQEQPAEKGCSCSFSSINQLGVLNGKSGIGALLQTVNGVRYKTWFAGVGVGIDVYKRGSIPVFLAMRKDLSYAKATPFVYADAGISFPDKEIESINAWYENVYSKGFYSDAGVGYRFGGKRRGGAVVSAGYSYKRLGRIYRYKQQVCDYCGSPNVYTYTSYLHRISLKVGWQL